MVKFPSAQKKHELATFHIASLNEIIPCQHGA